MKGHPRLYSTPARPGETFTAAQLRERAGRPGLNVTQYVKQGTPIRGHVYTVAGTAPAPKPKFGVQATPIVCDCRDCRGREWPIAEILLVSGRKRVNAVMLPGIGRLLGHPLAYRKVDAVGVWRKASAVEAVTADAPTPHRFNSSAEAMGVLPVNPKWLDVHCTAGGEA